MDGINRACATFALNAAWQVVAIAVAAALGGWLMRKAPARYQHALWLRDGSAAYVAGLCDWGGRA